MTFEWDENKNAINRKNFIIADFSPSPGPVSEYGMTFFHRDRLSFPHRRESTKKASISLWIPAGAEPVPGLRQGRLSRRRGNSLSPDFSRAGSGEGQGRRGKIIQSAIMKKSQKNAEKRNHPFPRIKYGVTR